VLDGERDSLRRLLEDRMAAFRLVRGAKSSELRKNGWLRCVRQAAGIPVDEVAERLGVCRWEVHRLEESERNSRIMLATLKNAAKGLRCELVYALVPLEGTLNDMADAQNKEREIRRHERDLHRTLKPKPWLELLRWRGAWLRGLRIYLRREGIRVRPRKTERGDKEQLAAMKEKMGLAARADLVAKGMKEAERKRE
jgi:transcriptional regulator with XRE-family HTH domain